MPTFNPSGSSGLDLLAAAASATPQGPTPTATIAPPSVGQPGPFNLAASLPPKVVKKILDLEFVEMAELTTDDSPSTVLGWFRIGFNHSSQLKSATTNMQSAFEHPEVISQYLQKERPLGHLLGPFEGTSDLPPVQINRFGVIPKGHNMGKWRLIRGGRT